METYFEPACVAHMRKQTPKPFTLQAWCVLAMIAVFSGGLIGFVS